MRQNYIMGNWKMNGNQQSAMALAEELLQALPADNCAELVVFPPAIYIPCLSTKLKDSAIALGAQNIHSKDAGAYTGELSAAMLADFACPYVLVGHSERRHLFHEDENFIAEKFHQVKLHGMIPVLCVGETEAERQQGLTEQVLRRQLLAISKVDASSAGPIFAGSLIAYEPVWAIGTGLSASPEQAQEAHAYIRSVIAEFDLEIALQQSILYGGSVTEKNAKQLFAMPDIDGALVGGASLKAEQFVEIIKCIN